MPYAKNTIKVNVPKRSGFDKSHRQTGTSFCGTLTPLLCDELIPNSRVSLRLPIAVQLPPLASDTFMNLKYKVEAFFCPMRLICGSFEDWFTLAGEKAVYDHKDVNPALPVIKIDSDIISRIGKSSLADYLGIKFDSTTLPGSDLRPISVMPFLAYHMVYQHWYMNPRVQVAPFSRMFGSPFATSLNACELPYSYLHSNNITGGLGNSNYVIGSNRIYLADGETIFSIRQRNFGLDYFTGARLEAQQGDPSAVEVETLPDSNTGFTIASLRAANSLQQFKERNNLPSTRLVDQVKARYGANLSDGVAQRPICIGTASYDVSTRGIDQTASTTGTPNNPFNSVASQYGRAYASGSDFIINDFTANEPGYLLVIGSLVPEVTYATGILPMFRRYTDGASIVNMANPLLQNVGDQPILPDELNPLLPEAAVFGGSPFGYQDRYSDFMFIPNQSHGEFSESGSLKSFVLKRSFTGTPTLSSSFIKIPKNYLDGVFATSTGLSGFSYWYDSYLNYKVSMPLAEFSIPSLQDPAYEHGQSVVLKRNGQIF